MDVGETLVVGVVADNVTNATLPTISSHHQEAAGETSNWVLIGSVDSSTATASGGVRGMLYAITAKVRWAAATREITITLSTAITAKAAVSRHLLRCHNNGQRHRPLYQAPPALLKCQHPALRQRHRRHGHRRR